MLFKHREMDLEVKRLEKEFKIINVSYGIIWHLSAELFLEDGNEHDEDEVGIHLKPEYDNFSRYYYKIKLNKKKMLIYIC